MPSQRLCQVLKKLRQPMSFTSTHSESNDIPDTSYSNNDTNARKRPLITTSGSILLLQAVEQRKCKNRKCSHAELPSSSMVPLEKNVVVAQPKMNEDTNNTRINDTADSHSIKNNDDILRSIEELRRVYLYGLQTVSKLQDLRDAPDAILPGNFCDNQNFSNK